MGDDPLVFGPNIELIRISKLIQINQVSTWFSVLVNDVLYVPTVRTVCVG